MANQQIVKCELTDSVIYEQDAIRTKSGYISILGEQMFLSNRYEYLKSKRWQNFALYLLPYLLAIFFFVFAVIMAYTNLDGGEYVVISVGLADVIIFVASAAVFMTKHNVLDDIGDPEAIVVEVTGSIDVDSGTVSAYGRAYDAYSSGQIASIFVNIVKFVFVFVALVLLSWLYWIIYIVRRVHTKKTAQKLIDTMNRTPQTMTGIIICACDQKGFEVFDSITSENGEDLCIQQKYYNTFWLNGTIYGLFGNPNDVSTCDIVEVLPGYDNRIITDESQKEELLQKYKSL